MNNPIPGGSFYLARTLFDSKVWFKPPLYTKIWIWILGKASYSDREIKGIPCTRGEFVTTYDGIIRANSYWKNNAHLFPSLKQVRIILEWLKFEGMIQILPQYDNRFLTRADPGADPEVRTRAYLGIKITVINYHSYQNPESYKGRPQGEDLGIPLGPTRADNNNNKDKKEITTLSGKKIPDPRVKEFFDYWGETFQRETERSYVFSFGKEGKLIEGFLKVHSLELLQETIKAFFRDERCKQRGLDIGIFKLEINRLIGLKAMDPLAQARRDLGMTLFKGQQKSGAIEGE